MESKWNGNQSSGNFVVDFQENRLLQYVMMVCPQLKGPREVSIEEASTEKSLDVFTYLNFLILCVPVCVFCFFSKLSFSIFVACFILWEAAVGRGGPRGIFRFRKTELQSISRLALRCGANKLPSTFWMYADLFEF